MPSKIRMIQAIADQEVSELSDEMVRLAAAKDAEIAKITDQRDRATKALNNAWIVIEQLRAEIAALTEQRDAARKVALSNGVAAAGMQQVVEAARTYREAETDGTPRMCRGKALQDLANALDDALAALDAEAAAETEGT